MSLVTDDLRTVLTAVQHSMQATGQGPDVPVFLACADPEKEWYDPRRPLASDVWRVLAGLRPLYYGVPKEVAEHAEHGRKFFGGHPCLCEICIGHRKDPKVGA